MRREPLDLSKIELIISIHAPLAGCDRSTSRRTHSPRNFNPRTPCGVRRSWRCPGAAATYFNPRTPCGVRHAPREVTSSIDHFNPRTPCGVRLLQSLLGFFACQFQSTHPLRGATLVCAVEECLGRISIHAPLAGCDFILLTATQRTAISIHAPLAGCDKSASVLAVLYSNFNPRTPCGVRRNDAIALSKSSAFQSTHPLRGATKHIKSLQCRCHISIHAPLAGCDMRSESPSRQSQPFQSTHPLRGATLHGQGKRNAGNISIHAPLAGCDFCRLPLSHHLIYFNPRTPCGVRHRFESYIHRGRISIHAPLAGCDAACAESLQYTADFNPRTPCGVRRYTR